MGTEDKLSLWLEQSLFSFDDLRLVVALAKAGSLAAAARHLAVNHASAWRRLGTLETRLGVRLFERGRAGYATTPAGEEVVATAGTTLRALDELGRKIAGQDVRPTGRVRLTTTETLLDLLMPALATFNASHPGIQVDVVTSNAFFTLTRQDADVALRPAETAPEGLVARRLADVASAIYGAPGTADATSNDLTALDWVAPDDSLSHIASFKWVTDRVPAARIRLRASSLTALRSAVRAGIGVGALPCFIGDPDPTLVRIASPIAEMGSSLWLITHPDLRRTPRIRAVLDHLAAHFSRQKAIFAGHGLPDGETAGLAC